MEITDVAENQRVDIDLTFDKPFKSQNKTTFMLASEGEQTTVTWTITGPRPLLMRPDGAAHEHGQARRQGLREGARPDGAGGADGRMTGYRPDP